jgi:hypothetical protein
MDLRTAAINQVLRLELLGINPLKSDQGSILKASLKQNSVALIVKRVSKALMILLPMRDIRDLDRFSIRIQNEKLPGIIALKKDEIQRLTTDIQRFRDYRADLKRAKSEYADLNSFYKQGTPGLIELRKMLDQLENREKERYTEKGPNGFPESYHALFPEVFETLQPMDQPYSIEDLDTLKENELNRRAFYPGGPDKLSEYIERNLRYPETAYEAMLEGLCYLGIRVSSTGLISDFKILRGVPGCSECNEEALRLASRMENWKPSLVNGKAVSSFTYFPIRFRIER